MHVKTLGVDRKPYIVAGIPAYNEEMTIAKVVLKVKRYVDKVIVCDDGSTDMTSQIAGAVGAEILRNERNTGKGSAIRKLFERAKEEGADVMITIDADGQHDPDEIPKLLKMMFETDADIVVGSRFLNRESIKKVPRYRYLGNRFLNLLTPVKNITDTQSGFRAYSKRAIERISPSETGFAVDSEILYKAVNCGLKIVEVPINVEYNVPNSLKRNPISHGFDVTLSLIKMISMRHPLAFYGIPGSISLIVSILTGLTLLHEFNITRYFSLTLATMFLGFGMITTILCSTALILWVLTTTLREKS
ncbi:MAG: glycosyltransferase family 2 protein [Desulfurococcaceae archaeon]